MASKRRKNYTGSIDSYTTEDGERFRVRAQIDGKLTVIASKLKSRTEAEEYAKAYNQTRSARELVHGLTLSQYGVGFLERRRKSGVRGIERDVRRWSKNIDRREIGNLPLSSITRSDVVAWRNELFMDGLSHGSQSLCLTNLRVAFDEALDLDLVDSNPVRDVKAKKDRQDVAKELFEHVLTPPQQRRLLETAPSPTARNWLGLALLTGIRLSELRELAWEDVTIADTPKGRAGYLTIRRSEKGKATKSGLVRRVELLGPAIAILDSMPRRSKWVLCGKRNGRPPEGKAPVGAKAWREWRDRAGLDLRWHDLRHTCATSLLAGWWGRAWSIEAVSKQLGHSSITMTERYARKVDDLTRNEARGMFQNSDNQKEGETVEAGLFTGANYPDRTGDLRVTNALLYQLS